MFLYTSEVLIHRGLKEADSRVLNHETRLKSRKKQKPLLGQDKVPRQKERDPALTYFGTRLYFAEFANKITCRAQFANIARGGGS